MEAFFDNLTGLVAVVCSLGIPIIVVIMVFLRKMKRDRQLKEIRQLIIENHTDPETAKLLIDEPKKNKGPRKPGTVDLSTLRTACIMLGIGLGAFINWLCEHCGQNLGTIYFWLIIAFGIGVGMLASFIVEMQLAKKQNPQDQSEDLSKEQ